MAVKDNVGRVRAVWENIPTQVLIAVALLVALAFPLLGAAGLLQEVWMRVAAKVAIYVLLALGLNIIIGETGLLNLGYVAFFAIGAYTTAILSSPRFDLDFPFWSLIILSALAAMAFGFLLGLPTLRLRGDYLAIVTLAFGEITRITLNNWEPLTNGPGGIPGIHEPVIAGFAVNSNTKFYYLTLLLIVLAMVALRNLKNSRIGRAWNALREDELAAECSGINIARAKLLSFMISAMLAGVAGCIFAGFQAFVNPQYFDLMQSVLIVSMVVLGGMGSLAGVVVGAVALDSLPEVIRHVFSDWLPAILGENFYASWPQPLQTFFTEFDRFRMLFFGLAMVLMIVFRPEGLIPNRRRARELRETDPLLQSEAVQSQYDLDAGREDLEV